MRPLVSLIFPALLAACSSWPQAGQGGFAERSQDFAVAKSESKAITCAATRLAELERAGETQRKPADAVAARLLLQRIVREHSGGLVEEAAHDLVGLDNILTRLAAGQEAHLKSFEGCPS